MTKRISLGGGKYCYAGPNCRLHSPTGILHARELRNAAVDAYANAGTLAEMESAQKMLNEAALAYDATEEGQRALEGYSTRTEDPITLITIRKRLEEAKAYEKKVEAEAAIAANQVVPEDGALMETISMSSEIEAARFEKDKNIGRSQKFVGPNGRGSANAWRGSKFTPGDGPKEVKKKLNADIKEAVASGYLPKRLQYAISATGYDQLSISVRGLSDEAIYVSQDPSVREDHWKKSHKPEAQELLKRLNHLRDSYNYVDDDPWGDYSGGTRFYGRVELENEYYRKGRLGA